VIIVKVGGSLYNTPELHHWLLALEEFSAQQSIVLVPGGGPFADQVRTAQELHHFDDDTAHHMAILAMKQFGLLLSALAPSCQTINTHDIPSTPFSIWLPDDKLLSESSLLKSWDISSDSIALWLASKLKAKQLFLIKYTSSHATSINELASKSIVDNGFAQLFANSNIDTKIINYQAYDNLSDYISNSNGQLSLQLP